MAALPPGSTIGILGGGQLGRMLALAAAELGFRCHVYSAEEDAPACAVAAQSTRAAYNDHDALARFAASVDVVTAEFENVPAETAEMLADRVSVRPGPLALAVAQDRLTEKEFARKLFVPTAPFANVGQRDDLDAALAVTGLPALLKTRRLGYDGKGQVSVASAHEAAIALGELGGRNLILEQRIDFWREASVLLARTVEGKIAVYDMPWNRHEKGILARSAVPSGLPAEIESKAIAATTRLAEALDYVGVIAVEFFVTRNDAGQAQLLFNEFAPRVHNSGHWTQDACAVSQFQQHIRAVAGWPLGTPVRHSDAVMDNLIGADAETWLTLAGEAQAYLHLYGKHGIRPGRKMGHVTRLYPLNGRPRDSDVAGGSASGAADSG